MGNNIIIEKKVYIRQINFPNYRTELCPSKRYIITKPLLEKKGIEFTSKIFSIDKQKYKTLTVIQAIPFNLVQIDNTLCNIDGMYLLN